MNNKITELRHLKELREDLWKKIKIVEDNSKTNIRKDIDELTKNITTLKKEVKLCEEIKKRKDSIKEDIKKLEEKEMVKDEHIK